MLTPVEVEQLRALLNKGKGDGKHWDLTLPFEDYMRFRVLVAKALDMKDAETYQEYVSWRQDVLREWQKELELKTTVLTSTLPAKVVKGGKRV